MRLGLAYRAFAVADREVVIWFWMAPAPTSISSYLRYVAMGGTLWSMQDQQHGRHQHGPCHLSRLRRMGGWGATLFARQHERDQDTVHSGKSQVRLLPQINWGG